MEDRGDHARSGHGFARAGTAGKMPFWHGDRPGRPTEFGQAIGALARELAAAKPEAAAKRLREEHGLDARAATNLIAYLDEQREATGEVPSDRTIVVERYRDDIGTGACASSRPGRPRPRALGDRGARGARESHAGDVEALWSDDGMVFRVPETDEPPQVSLFLPPAEEVEDLVVRSLGEPRSSPRGSGRTRRGRSCCRGATPAGAARSGSSGSGPRTCWRWRRATDPSRSSSRPTARPARRLRPARPERHPDEDRARSIRVVTRDTRTPSPFAASLLFSYVANFIYDGDAPLAERRAQALSVDQAQLRELLGEAELRELFDPEAIESLERSLQRLEGRRVRHADGLHDLLLSLGDLSEEEIRQRSETPDEAPRWLEALVRERRVIPVRIAGEARFAAAEDAGRLRDALGIVPPPGLPAAFLESPQSGEPVTDLVSRYARTHGPFRLEDAAARWGLPVGVVRLALDRLAERGRVVEGEFLPGGRSREWSDAGTLRAIKRRSLAKLRREVEPVEPAAFARFLAAWQSVAEPRAGLEALLSAVEQLQGYPIPASVLETEVLPARVERYRPADLDSLLRVGRDRLARPRAARPVGRARRALPDRPRLSPRAARAPVDGRCRGTARRRGARPARKARRAVLPGPGRRDGRVRGGPRRRPVEPGLGGGDLQRHARAPALASRGRLAEGRTPCPGPVLPLPPAGPARKRGPLVSRAGAAQGSDGHRAPGGAVAGSPRTSRRADSRGRGRGGHRRRLLDGVSRAQGDGGGGPGAAGLLRGRPRRHAIRAGRSRRSSPRRTRGSRAEAARTLVLAATDPANPYGAALPWPSPSASDAAARPQRAAGAQVVLRSGELLAWIGRTETNLLTFLPADEPARVAAARELARALARLVESGRRRAVLVGKVDGKDPRESPVAPHLVEAGFLHASRGYLKRLSAQPARA